MKYISYNINKITLNLNKKLIQTLKEIKIKTIIIIFFSGLNCILFNYSKILNFKFIILIENNIKKYKYDKNKYKKFKYLYNIKFIYQNVYFWTLYKFIIKINLLIINPPYLNDNIIQLIKNINNLYILNKIIFIYIKYYNDIILTYIPLHWIIINKISNIYTFKIINF